MSKAKKNGVVKAGNGTSKVNGKAKFAEQAKAKAAAHQTKRLEFIAKFGKVLAAAWAKMEHPSSMGVWRAVFPKEEEPCRLTDYALFSLGIRQSKDAGLIAWMKADALTATSEPKARKAKSKDLVKREAKEAESVKRFAASTETKATKLRKDLGAAMSDGQVNV